MRAARPSTLPFGWALACTELVIVSCRSPHDAPAPAPAPSSLAELRAPPDSRAHPVGELGHARDYAMSVESIRDCPTEPRSPPKRGFVRVGVELVIEGTSAIEVPVNPFYATLTDKGVDAYTSTLAGCEPWLPWVRVTAGKQARGFVTFEIPKAARKLELQYAPAVLGAGTEELRFSLIR